MELQEGIHGGSGKHGWGGSGQEDRKEIKERVAGGFSLVHGEQ